MKILYLLPDPAWHSSQHGGGYSVHVQEVIAALERAGHEVELVDAPQLRGQTRENPPEPVETESGGGPGTGRKLLGFLPARLRAVGRDLLYLARSLPVRAWLAERTKRGDVDLIYERFHHMQWSGADIARRRRIPIIIEFNAGQNEIVSHLEPGLPGLGLRVEGHVLSSADRVIVVSEVLRKDLIKRGVAPENVCTVHNGVDLNRFHPELDGRAVRDRLGVGQEEILVGFVGSFAPWHGVQRLIEAASELLPTDPGIRYLLVGGKPGSAHFRDIQEMIAAGGLGKTVLLAGRVPHDEIASYIAAMDVATVPEATDYGSPMKIFEYMAMGRAIIVPDRPPIREVLSHDVDAVITPGTASDLAATIRRLAKDPGLRRKLGANARERAVARHSWDVHARMIQKLYEDIRRQRSPGLQESEMKADVPRARGGASSARP